MTPSEFKEARKSLGLTQSKLADLIHAGTRSIRHWEDGTRAIPGPVDVLMTILLGEAHDK